MRNLSIKKILKQFEEKFGALRESSKEKQTHTLVKMKSYAIEGVASFENYFKKEVADKVTFSEDSWGEFFKFIKEKVKSDDEDKSQFLDILAICVKNKKCEEYAAKYALKELADNGNVLPGVWSKTLTSVKLDVDDSSRLLLNYAHFIGFKGNEKTEAEIIEGINIFKKMGAEWHHPVWYYGKEVTPFMKLSDFSSSSSKRVISMIKAESEQSHLMSSVSGILNENFTNKKPRAL